MTIGVFRDDAIHDDDGPCRFIAGVCNLCGATGQDDPADPFAVSDKKLARRGTTNRNSRGGSDDRRRRREWLVQTYRADKDVAVIELFEGPLVVPVLPGTEGARPACRCYRCGALLTVDTVTADRIVPGCKGGTYRRSNIRPCCPGCNSSTGGALAGKGSKK